MSYCITMAQLIIAFREGFMARQTLGFDERWASVMERNNQLQAIWIWFNSSAGIMVCFSCDCLITRELSPAQYLIGDSAAIWRAFAICPHHSRLIGVSIALLVSALGESSRDLVSLVLLTAHALRSFLNHVKLSLLSRVSRGDSSVVLENQHHGQRL